MTALGIAIGMAVSFALSRILQSLLFQVSPTDVLTFASVPFVLAAVALSASWFPARRATRIDPITSLKAE
jgi:ABC-type antimicrobial peptide transport system permease subunit